MREIELTQGQVALVDDADYEFLSQWKWFAAWDAKLQGYYAMRTTRVSEHGPCGKPRTIRMHRVVAERMGLAVSGLEVDHIDRKTTLDNRRGNLRVATSSQSRMNTSPRLGSTSRFKGVSWHKARGKWEAAIQVNGRRHHLGLFIIEEDAARMYDRAAGLFHREFAVINIPSDLPAWYGQTLRSQPGVQLECATIPSQPLTISPSDLLSV